MGKIAGRTGRRWLTPGLLGSVWMAAAQTHKVAKPEQVVRAVGVYEWTGDQTKPSASRLVPVTVYIDGELRDGGVYLPRPIPFALVPGNEYEVERAGVTQGLVVLDYARHLTPAAGGGGAALDEDGWYGYGTYKPVVAKKEPALKAARTPGVIASSGGSAKAGADAKDAGTAPGGTASGKDADRPTLHRKDGSGRSDSTGSQGGGGTTATPPGATGGSPDPDRPTLGRRADGSGSGDTASGADSQADPDRPTLKRRSADSGKKGKPKDDVASVTSADVLGTDPDRPSLHRGRPAHLDTAEFAPKSLVGVPADVHQVAAVSDAVTRPEHDFARPWTDETERLAVLGQMRTMATQRLAQYAADPANRPATGAVSGGSAAAGATGSASARAGEATTANGTGSSGTGSSGTGSSGTGSSGTGSSGTGSSGTGTAGHAAAAGQGTAAARARARAAAARAKAAGAPGVSLVDEQLRGFVLSYGGAATYVYTAHIAGEGASLRYVTVVAQAEVTGDLRPALISATDAAHLDRTPWMRFVDVVDAEASNRASLLFELRAQNSRQFALYRVLGDRADQLVATGTSP